MSGADRVQARSGTWHYGLVARWWAEVNRPDEAELAYLRTAIHRFGEPALDLGCGAGRLLLPRSRRASTSTARTSPRT